MTKRNHKTAKMLQQGGLMIEALAMLGLISVVTPTMYKKAAERTMEVEDINTASTVRTYVSAAESYIANNYGTLMDTVFSTQAVDGNNNPIPNKRVPVADGTTWRLPLEGHADGHDDMEDFSAYLPYGFNAKQRLYDYDEPEIEIVKNGTNLTAFVLFPNTIGDDIGQERTARIAALVGSSGGYVYGEAENARGVGGMWEVPVSMFEESAPKYSIVAASSNIITDINGGELDNDKYLQRTLEEGEDQLWRNTMRTDLYMGKHLSGETQSVDESLKGRNSIRDVKSLIINAEKAAEVEEEDGQGGTTTRELANYALYIGKDADAPNNYTDTYIEGALESLAKQFVVKNKKLNDDGVKEARLYFGADGDADINADDYHFELRKNGNIYDKGYSGELFNRFKEVETTATGETVAENTINIGNGTIYAEYKNAVTADPDNNIVGSDAKIKMHLVNNSTFEIAQNAATSRGDGDMIISMLGNTMKVFQSANNPNPVDGIIKTEGENRITMFRPVDVNGVITDSATGEPGMTVNGVSGKDSLGNDIGPKYGSTPPDFRVDIGSNVKVQGVLAAGQVDAQHLRTASFASGSENIDDAEKWMTVDKDGVEIKARKSSTPHGPMITAHATGYETVEGHNTIKHYKGIHMASDWDAYNPDSATESDMTGGASISLTSGENYADATANLSANDIHMELRGDSSIREIYINGGEVESDSVVGQYDARNDYRVRVEGGNLDLDAANLNITDENNKPVFSVRGNAERERGATKFNNRYTRDDPRISNPHADYNVAVHGNALFASQNLVSLYTLNNTETDATVKYLSVGTHYDEKAGVNIYAPTTANTVQSNVVVIDQSATANSTNKLEFDFGGQNVNPHVSGFSGGNLQNGTVYIRRGAIEIAPTPATTPSGSSGQFAAHEGPGVVRAGRFVANNHDRNSATAYRVPLLVNSYGTYNSNDVSGRYDTYMVNPAYTSVMRDIKLTTRGGARLSDILPDFINKGIYVANNTFAEGTNHANERSVRKTLNTRDYAGPYLGTIPAPQCPPGYGKVIAMHPIAFQMAQAGSLGYDGSRYYVQPDTQVTGKASGVTLDNIDSTTKIADRSPEYRQLYVAQNSSDAQKEVHLEGEGTIEIPGSTDLTVKLNRDYKMTLHTDTQGREDAFVLKNYADQTTGPYYVLTSKEGNSAKPLIFQQSTFLKTKVVQLKEGDYTYGWEALMGFIYPSSQYDLTGVEGSVASEGDVTWYWNIFPVLRGTLEAYATIYCYFDRTGTVTGDIRTTSDIDQYDYLNSPIKQYRPTNTTYRDKLNDPALKYNESW